MIKIELTDQQFKALSNKKLADVVKLINTINELEVQHPKLKWFLQAFLTNETVEIIYHGGSNSGAKRRVSPQSINENGNFRAFCVDSDSSKSFKLDKVARVQ